MSAETTTLTTLFKEKKRLLRDFGIEFSPIIQHRVIELYPNRVAIDNYIQKIILDYLDALDDRDLRYNTEEGI